MEELLLFFGALTYPGKGVSKDRIHRFLKDLNLYEFRHTKLRAFSKGMTQKVGLIQAFLFEPELLILDEPFAGLDSESRETVMDWMRKVHSKGVTLCFSSHAVEDVEQLCDRVMVIRRGRIVFEGGFSDWTTRVSNGRRIVYLDRGVKKMKSVLNPDQCQSEIRELMDADCVILSVRPQAQSADFIYRSLSESE